MSQIVEVHVSVIGVESFTLSAKVITTEKAKKMSVKLLSLASSEAVEALAQKTLDAVRKKFDTDFTQAFYDNMRDYLFEHHQNFQDEILDDVFRHICGEGWTRYKDRYSAKDMRSSIYQEHKEEINKQLGAQIFEENAELKKEVKKLENEIHKLRDRY